VCAVLPITALALISFSLVEKQLNEQSEKRLRQESKAVAVSIYERLVLLRTELKSVASTINSGFSSLLDPQEEDTTKSVSHRFAGLALVTDGVNIKPLLGQIPRPPSLTPEQRHHIASGKACLSYRVMSDGSPVIYMAVALAHGHPEHGVLLGVINRPYLWEAAERRPPMTELCILDRSRNILFASTSELKPIPMRLSGKVTPYPQGQLEWVHQGKAHLASYRSLFLHSNFLSSEWIVVLNKSKDDVLAPMADFKRSFPFIIVLSLGLVVILSMILIRKSLVPIELLRDATTKIAQGAFGHKVEINSADEFESLGRAFNDMSSKLREGQALLVRAAKMSTMGQMAAGIVHEIKQPLTAIHGLLELSLMEERLGDNRKRLEAALGAVERLDTILTNFRSFFRMSEEMAENVFLPEVISEVCELLDHQFRTKQIRCTVECAKGVPSILGHNQGLQQVFSNILINAMDALEHKQNGQRIITVRVSPSNGTIGVEVEDNGCGIPEEIQEHIFDPFFTTKDADKGTGLGMAIVESIIHSHHGKIEIESKVGVGTRFTIAFPAAPQNNH
jgi:signal transduction histidine kinase